MSNSQTSASKRSSKLVALAIDRSRKARIALLSEAAVSAAEMGAQLNKPNSSPTVALLSTANHGDDRLRCL